MSWRQRHRRDTERRSSTNRKFQSQQGRPVFPTGVGAVDLDTLLPLEHLRPGEWADVAEVIGEPGWVRRLAELGLRTGCRLRFLQSGWPCLLQIDGSRLSL